MLLLYSCFIPFLTSLVSGSVASDLGFVHFSLGFSLKFGLCIVGY